MYIYIHVSYSYSSPFNMSEDWGDELDDTPTGFAPVSPLLSPYPPGMSTCVCMAVTHCLKSTL